METIAVVLRQPEQIELNRLALTPPTADDVVVEDPIGEAVTNPDGTRTTSIGLLQQQR